MARPKTKEELKQQVKLNFEKLMDLIISLSPDERAKNFVFEDRDKNIRDVLVHLYEWHQLLKKWIADNLAKQNVHLLPKPYTWKTYPEMNVEFWKKHQNTSYQESVELLKNSHAEIVATINAFTKDELFEKKHFNWTGTTSLGSYCISASSSHYDWALKKIKKHKKALSF